MRALYLIIMVAVGLFGLAALRSGTDIGGGVFVLALFVLSGMFGAALLGRMPTGAFRDFWPVRMVRLWMQGTEKRLQERATGTPNPADRDSR